MCFEIHEELMLKFELFQTRFNFFNKLLGVFLFFLLRSDHEEVHDQDDRAKQKYLTKNTAAPYGSLC